MATKQIKVLISISIALVSTTQLQCVSQNYAYPQPQYRPSGFRSYTPGFAGPAHGTKFNGGFSGMNQQVQQNPQQSYYSPAAQTRSAQSTMQNLEQTLNAVDTNAAWSHTPVSGTATPQQQQMQQRPSLRSAASVPVHGAYTNNMQGMFPGVSRKEMMRVFMEGGSPQTGGGGWGGGGASAPAANSSANTSNAYNNYRTAVNEEAKSRNYANTARYDGSQWNRKNAASQAEYAANNANYAAQRAESAAYSGDSQARGYANLARQAANRARENANRARYNADTIR